MKKYIHTIIQTYRPILVLFVVEIALFATNYHPGTYLMGWDNVMPEFNFSAALNTNIFGAWQYHRGLGLPDGMGHAANLIHTLFLWLLSAALPQSVLRYAFHFLMHFLGMLGMYRLLRFLYQSSQSGKLTKASALIGGLFYGLNLITVQMFYTPLEAFSTHFAALPWLAYSLLQYYKKPSYNTLLLFIIVSIFSTPQFFIPTLILPVSLLLVIISLPYIKNAIRPGIYFLIVNSFWLLPYLTNLPYNASVIQNATINRMSSREIYARNQVFGDIPHILTLQGFMLDFEDVDSRGQPIFVMETWRNWIKQPAVTIVALGISSLMILGLWKSTWSGLIWIVSLVLLANNTPHLSTIMNQLRDHVPFFSEAYRFPFTKFGLLFGFAGTLLFTNALFFIMRGRGKLIIILLAVIIIGTIAFPAFTGHFFYDSLRMKLPNDYLKLFTFMQKQDHNGRIAYLPAPSYWSWKHYNHGYVGSGFVWYGLFQPLMDRAFDPWSQYNEQYYWELSHALYSNSAHAVNAVLSKYDVRYIIYDDALQSPGSNRALIPEETKAMLAQFPQIAEFGGLSVYEKTGNITNSYSLPVLDDTPLTDVYHDLFEADMFTPCGILKQGTAYAEAIGNTIRLHAINQRGCVSISLPSLSHQHAYKVSVISRHISGRTILFSLINNTAKHVEKERYLTGDDTFFLPPLASDGLGYTIYIASDGFGNIETVNEILDIRVSSVPYNMPTQSGIPDNSINLSQAYHPHWLAFNLTTKTLLTNHREIHDWKNGWDKPRDNQEVIFFFWPQLLEYLGFVLLGISAIHILSANKQSNTNTR